MSNMNNNETMDLVYGAQEILSSNKPNVGQIDSNLAKQLDFNLGNNGQSAPVERQSEPSFKLGDEMSAIVQQADLQSSRAQGITPSDSMFINKAEQSLLFNPKQSLAQQQPFMTAQQIQQQMMANPQTRPSNNSNMLIQQNRQESYSEMIGEFKVEKNFQGLDQAANFLVCHPQIPKGADYALYTVRGLDREGKFEIFRRYSDFEVLRITLVERFPGLYVPPIPHKRAIGNKEPGFLEERCFLLNLFMKQLSRCPYLLESEEYQIFVKPEIRNQMQRELQLLPRIGPESLLVKYQKYFSFIGAISDNQIEFQNEQIKLFQTQANKTLVFLNKFKDALKLLDTGFSSQLTTFESFIDIIKVYEINLFESYQEYKDAPVSGMDTTTQSNNFNNSSKASLPIQTQRPSESSSQQQQKEWQAESFSPIFFDGEIKKSVDQIPEKINQKIHFGSL